MECIKPKQGGYLLVASIILVFIFSVVGSLLAINYVKKGEAVANIDKTKQALYIATSALEIAKRSIINGDITCAAITGDSAYTNADLLGGKMTVTGQATSANNNLANNITASATSLTLTNASAFANEGVITIGNEHIGYYSKTGNTLTQLVRGLGGTTAASHTAATSVAQAQCLLQATGAVPDFNNPKGQQTVQEVLHEQTSGSSSAFQIDTPVITTASIFDLRGSAAIYNMGVVLNGPNYPGSTIVSGGLVDLRGSAITWVSNGSGGYALSSTSSNIQPDIIQNESAITPSNLYTQYFTEPLATIQADPATDTSYNKNNLSGVIGKTVWIAGKLKLTGSNTYNIGSPTEPVVLIIDGDFDKAGSTTINLYGLIYVTGDIKITGSAAINGQGTIASEGQAKITGSMNLNLNPAALGTWTVGSPYMNSGSSTTYGAYLFKQVNI